MKFRNSLTFQALPWLSGVFRYSGIGDKGPFISSGHGTWDRSFDLRINLQKEDSFKPNITIGLQDVIGTGYYSSEYLVFSKSLNRKLTTTAGFGWGRMGSANIIKKGSRVARNSQSTGGLLNYQSLFTGNIGLFGGFEYSPSIKGLKVKAEISSDDYSREEQYLTSLPSSNINYSAEYLINDSLSLSLFHLNNQSTGIQFNLSANPSSGTGGDYLENMPEPFYSIPFPKTDFKDIWSKIESDLKLDGIEVIANKAQTEEAIVVINNLDFPSHTKAIGRTLRVMSKYIPLEISLFTVILSSNDLPITKISINRVQLSEIIDAPNAEYLSKQITTIQSADKYIEVSEVKKNNDGFNWRISPYNRLHLFDPNRPIYYDVGLEGHLNYKIKNGLIFSLTTETSVVSTFDDIWRGAKGKLPKVRTDLKNYLNERDTRIKDLIVNSYYKIDKDIYGRTTLGYLEPMYAGVSSEILKFSSNNNLAYGIELNYLKPREFRQLFGLRNIKRMANFNGHLSTYWDTNYYNYLAQLDVGKYLANDNGGTFTLTRNFPNGWEVGGFFSITDVSFDDFGEGSFDKGVFVRIPFHILSPYETRYGYFERIRPLQGDGGQRVNVPGRLYNSLINMSSSNLSNSWYNTWR